MGKLSRFLFGFVNREGQMTKQESLSKMRVSPGFICLVDDWRRKQPVDLSRAEAIQRLAEFAIVAHGEEVVGTETGWMQLKR